MEKKKAAILLLIVSLPIVLSASSPSVAETIRMQILSQIRPFLQVAEFVWRHLRRPLSNEGKEAPGSLERKAWLGKIAQLESRMVELREIREENERLRRLLHFQERDRPQTIACQVVARDLSTLSHLVVLDKGERDGIQSEMPVVTEAGLAGKVIGVGPRVARAILLTDTESRVGGLVQRSREMGLVAGDGTPYPKMRYLEEGASVERGDAVVTSGLGSVFPKGLLIGWVKEIRRDPNGFHQVAVLKPAVELSRLEEVLCLRSPSKG